MFRFVTMASSAASTDGSRAFCDARSSAAPLSTLCPSDCPENCPECTLQPRPATSTSSQSSQLQHPGRLCWNGCQCRSIASGKALKQQQFLKRHDTSVNKFREMYLERDATIMTHRLHDYLHMPDNMRSYCLCGTYCGDPRRCVTRLARSRSVKQHERPSTAQLYTERRN